MSLVERIKSVTGDRFFTQERVGSNGTTFTIYKLHSMIEGEGQRDELVESNGKGPFGHVDNDPRITKSGAWKRKYWIDELPQIINLIKGDLALVGARSLVREDYESLPDDLKEKRKRYGHGLNPVTYADYFEIMQGKIDRFESERRYFDKKENNPTRTDINYFLKIWYNIIFKGARGF